MVFDVSAAGRPTRRALLGLGLALFVAALGYGVAHDTVALGVVRAPRGHSGGAEAGGHLKERLGNKDHL